MSLWVDKYRPCSFARLDYHKEQAAQLSNLVQFGDFPHLLVYGPSGAGKNTRIMCILQELYGVGVKKLRFELNLSQFAVYYPLPARRKIWFFLRSWLTGWQRSPAGTSGKPY
ncbi:replication factor C subunit 3-like [Microtus pennsylvanicus]|uniref:replication factor C subunit 3-like n=1 Tax=Microtus pennsylvanicus TaxID=10058 RepID=UPI003F6C4068